MEKLKTAKDNLKLVEELGKARIEDEMKNIILAIDTAVGLGSEWVEYWSNISTVAKRELENAGYKLQVFEGYRLVIAWGEMPTILFPRFNLAGVPNNTGIFKFNEYPTLPCNPFYQYQVICSTSKKS